MRRISVIVWILLAWLSSVQVRAQQPFITDDADVTAQGKTHLELSNELDKLQITSLPVTKQNGFRATFAYGLARDLEGSIGAQILTLIGASPGNPHAVTGIGDTTFAAKYNFYHEREDSRLPALAISGFVQLPTGDARRSLGSGVTDYGFYLVAQKTVRKKNIVRVNAGYLFAGNTLNGAEGLAQVKGQVFTGDVSVVKKFTEKLQLGAEVTSDITNNFQLSKGQLQTQAGGNYQICKKLSLDFGVIAGRFAASPRVGVQLGTSIDF